MNEVYQSPQFQTTHWSVVLNASGPETLQQVDALEKLCCTYWYPLYVFVRRQGHGHEEARDLVQGFFEELLRKKDLATVSPEKGRFRTFLLTALNHYLANQWDYSQCQKRGGGYLIISMDEQQAADRYRLEPVDSLSPERLYERHWAETMVSVALEQLSTEWIAEGQAARFEMLKGVLTGDWDEAGYAQLSQQMGMSEGGVKSAVRRMRLRFRELLRAQIVHTVADPGQVDEEMRFLLQALLAR